MKMIFVYIMGFFYVVAGLNHFIHPEFYLKIMPSWLPAHRQLVFISGICEVICGLLVLFPATRKVGAWATIALLMAVFPANIQMMLNYRQEDNPLLWVSIARLPLQLLLIWWAYKVGKKG